MDKTQCNGDTNSPAELNNNKKKRKLVLHFDVRNTLIVADTVTNISVEQAMNAYLTGVLWGKELDSGQWLWSSKVPSLAPPAPDTVTFYRHLEREMVKVPSDRVKLRLAVADFVHTDVGRKFADYVHDHLKLLEWQHPPSDFDKATLRGKDNQEYHYILPSAYRVIEKLTTEGRDFSVNIRTYGLDCPTVLASMSYFLSTKCHPQFPSLPDMNVNTQAGFITRKDGGFIEITEKRADSSIVLSNEDEIYKHFCKSTGVTGYQDDFQFWNGNGYHHQSSKPVWVDPEDDDHLHILFDDNYRPNNTDSVADLRLRQKDGSWRSLDTEQVDGYENISLVQVDLLEAIADVDYYVNKVHECETNLSQMKRKSK